MKAAGKNRKGTSVIAGMELTQQRRFGSDNGQLALGVYLLDRSGVYRPNHLAVLTFTGDKIDRLDAFHDPMAPDRFGLPDRA